MWALFDKNVCENKNWVLLGGHARGASWILQCSSSCGDGVPKIQGWNHGQSDIWQCTPPSLKKSITEAQLQGYSHQTKSKVCCAYIRPLHKLVLLSIDFPLRTMKNSLTILTGLTTILWIIFKDFF